MVINFDKHDQPGSHWVGIFIDVPKRRIGYFDSYGMCPPPDLISKYIRRACRDLLHGSSGEIEMKFKCNKNRHQFKNSECGVYSIYFILQSLKGRSFDEIFTNIIYDDTMNAKRDLYFRPSKINK